MFQEYVRDNLLFMHCKQVLYSGDSSVESEDERICNGGTLGGF
jgi:hypothetical protein